MHASNHHDSQRRMRRARTLLAALGATAIVSGAVLLTIPAGAAADARAHHGHKHDGKKHNGHKGGGKKHNGHKHGQGHQHDAPPAVAPSGLGPAFGAVTVAPAGPGQRLVTVETTGPAMSLVEICDLPTHRCVEATLDSGRWVARLPAPDPDRYAIGLIGLSGAIWVIGNSSSDPPAFIPPPVNIG